MKIADITFRDQPLFLAPMEDVTDLVFRSLCKDYGADMLYTEFVSSDALIREIEKSKDKLILRDSERPVGIQIYGKDPDAMVEAAKIAEAAGPDLIDLNFGCPVKKIAVKGAGSGMLKTPELLLEITERIVKAVKLPVTVKTRLGWDENTLIIETLAEQLQDVGISALTIHGRTRSQLYTGTADWEKIGTVKNNPRIKIPIIGNGDVTTPDRARECFDKYGVDAVMIGRATIGRPWIFREIRHYLDTGELLQPLSMEEHVDFVKKHLCANVEWLGERRGILHTRRHIAVTFKGLPHFRDKKIKLLQSSSFEEIIQLLSEVADEYKGFIPSEVQCNTDLQSNEPDTTQQENL